MHVVGTHGHKGAHGHGHMIACMCEVGLNQHTSSYAGAQRAMITWSKLLAYNN